MAEYLKIPEVARRLDVSEKTARRYIKAGTLPSTFIGGVYRITEEDLNEFIRRAEVRPEDASPKAERRSPSEPSLFNGLEDERREAIYGPWLDFVNRYADRWESRLASGEFDLGNVNELLATLEDLMPVLHELNADEVRGLPEQPSTFGAPGAKTGVAIWRLVDLIDPLIEAGTTKFNSSDLEQLRRKRDETRRELERSA